MTLTKPIVTLLEHPLSGRDIILPHLRNVPFREPEKEMKLDTRALSFSRAILQIVLLDLVFSSLGSVITAIGMTTNIPVMRSSPAWPVFL